MMHQTTSADGTTIAYDRIGSGPAVILVDGALCHRNAGPNPKLAKLLADRFTVFTYDRRGRGDSGNTLPYTAEREIEDLHAVIRAAGGSANVYGISSGAPIALDAANRGLGVRRVVVYEAPFVVDQTRPPVPDRFPEQLQQLIAAGRRGAAVKLFMKEGVRVPAVFVALMTVMPAWPKLKAVAHTLPYDMTICADGQTGGPLPAGRWATVAIPALIVCGGKSPDWIRNAGQALVQAVPAAHYRTLEGQTHIVKPAAIAPLVADFFTD
jgi:pimeloyl-ACP methyl ester carboxylesterase